MLDKHICKYTLTHICYLPKFYQNTYPCPFTCFPHQALERLSHCDVTTQTYIYTYIYIEITDKFYLKLYTISIIHLTFHKYYLKYTLLLSILIYDQLVIQRQFSFSSELQLLSAEQGVTPASEVQVRFQRTMYGWSVQYLTLERAKLNRQLFPSAAIVLCCLSNSAIKSVANNKHRSIAGLLVKFESSAIQHFMLRSAISQ